MTRDTHCRRRSILTADLFPEADETDYGSLYERRLKSASDLNNNNNNNDNHNSVVRKKRNSLPNLHTIVEEDPQEAEKEEVQKEDHDNNNNNHNSVARKRRNSLPILQTIVEEDPQEAKKEEEEVNEENNKNNHNLAFRIEQLSTNMLSILPQEPKHAAICARVTFPILIRPILAKIEKRAPAVGQELIETLRIVEASDPEVLLEFIDLIVVNSQQFLDKVSYAPFSPPTLSPASSTTSLSSISSTSSGVSSISSSSFAIPRPIYLPETLLNIQSKIPDFEEQTCMRQEEIFQHFKSKTILLKRNLSKLPKEVDDRNKLLATIRHIAEIIKSVLECINIILNNASIRNAADASCKRNIEQRKREFISDSKDFSTALKQYFRDNRHDAVYLQALRLIKTVNTIQRTIKQACEHK